MQNVENRLDPAWRRAAGLACWHGKVDPKPLCGGISNTNFLVDDAGRRCVVRIADDVEVHGLVRRNEFAASRAAYLAGISPEVIHSEAGALVLAFVDGRTLKPEDIRQPEQLGRIMELLRRCHREVPKHLRGPALVFWVFHAIRDYRHRLEDEHARTSQDIAYVTAAAERLERAIGPVDIVFGHNDLLAANLIDDGDRLWLIDWEYGGFNTPLFDLGNLASNNSFGPELRDRMLELYFERPVTDELRFRLAAMIAASLMRETLWSMVSEIHSHLDFDYRAYTAEYLSRYEAALAEFDAMERQ